MIDPKKKMSKMKKSTAVKGRQEQSDKIGEEEEEDEEDKESEDVTEEEEKSPSPPPPPKKRKGRRPVSFNFVY